MWREKQIAAADVPTPIAGTATMFVDSADGLLKQKLPSGLVVSPASTPSAANVVWTSTTITDGADYTVADGIAVVYVDYTSGGTIPIIRLPSPSTNVGRVISIAPSRNEGVDMTVTILDEAGASMYPGADFAMMHSNGTAWQTLIYPNGAA